MNNQLNWLRLTAVNGRTKVGFRRDKSYKEYRVRGRHLKRINRILWDDSREFDVTGLVVDGGMMIEYYIKEME